MVWKPIINAKANDFFNGKWNNLDVMTFSLHSGDFKGEICKRAQLESIGARLLAHLHIEPRTRLLRPGSQNSVWSKANTQKLQFDLCWSLAHWESGRYIFRLRIFNLLILHLKNWSQMVFSARMEMNEIRCRANADSIAFCAFQTKIHSLFHQQIQLKLPSVRINGQVAELKQEIWIHNHNYLIYRFHIGNKPYSNGA